MRRTITRSMVAAGLILMVVGYLGAAPWGADAVVNSDPRFAFAPAVFVLGVVVAFAAALVYELMPERREK